MLRETTRRPRRAVSEQQRDPTDIILRRRKKDDDIALRLEHITFRRGHRIRVAVTSSSFPRFDRNLNTGGVFGAEARGEVALNTVFHDAARPSRIILPVVG